MKKKKHSPTTKDLIKIAGKLSRPVKQMDQPMAEYLKLLGRLNGIENDKEASFDLIIDSARNGIIRGIWKGNECFFMVQTAIWLFSNSLWEKLWNEKHPDRYGKASDEDSEDFDLMEVWRAKVRNTIKECHQDAALDMTHDEYVANLSKSETGKKIAKQMADWMGDVHYEDEKDLLNAREEGTTGPS